MTFGREYPHSELYSSQTGTPSDPHAGRHRSKTYRELRSQPETPSYTDHRPKTSDPALPQQHYLQGITSYQVSPPAHNFLSHTIPTVLLNLDFVVARHNRAFSDALSLSFTARAQTLLDLVIPAEREKIQRLQSIMRAELREAAHMRDGQSSHTSIPAIENLDIAHATEGFRTRSEYWTFRLPRDQSRGFPISISLAKDGAHFVVLTLVQSTSNIQAVQSAPPQQGFGQSPPLLPSSSIGGLQSPPQPLNHTLAHHPHHQRYQRNSPSDAALPYLVSSSYDEQMSQVHPSDISFAQYKQSSPPHPIALPYSTKRTDSGSSGSSEIPRSSPGHQHQPLDRENLRHLQLPPIRMAPTSDPSAPKDPMRRRKPSETPSPARRSPQGTQSSKMKKRRRVDIGEMLH